MAQLPSACLTKRQHANPPQHPYILPGRSRAGRWRRKRRGRTGHENGFCDPRLALPPDPGWGFPHAEGICTEGQREKERRGLDEASKAAILQSGPEGTGPFRGDTRSDLQQSIPSEVRYEHRIEASRASREAANVWRLDPALDAGFFIARTDFRTCNAPMQSGRSDGIGANVL